MANLIWINNVISSPFEEAITALGPLAWYQFRQPDYNTQVNDSSGNGYHLTKQIAAATIATTKTRLNHPGGANFPSVTAANWATQGTFYKGTTGLLSGATQYTLLISMRMIKQTTGANHKIFAIGTENAAESGTNDLLLFRDNVAENIVGSKHRTNSPGLIPAETNETGIVADGVNRLYITRYTVEVIHRLTTTKPGHLELVEENADATSGTALDVLSKALILNANLDVAADPTPGFIVDQIALFSTDIGATAATNLATLWQAEVAGAGYYPSMMDFDGSTGYYTAAYTSSGNDVTVTATFEMPSFAGGTVRTLLAALGPANRSRTSIFIYSTDYADTDRRNTIQVVTANSAGTVICRLFSTAGAYTDGAQHTLFYAFDGDAGTAVFRIDGTAVDDTLNADRVAPTAGTLDMGVASTFLVGKDGSTNYYDGVLGFIGMRDVYLTNYSDFMTGNLPKAINESAWTEWGAQPLFWSHTGQMDNSKGSVGDMTKNGTITMTEGGSP